MDSPNALCIHVLSSHPQTKTAKFAKRIARMVKRLARFEKTSALPPVILILKLKTGLLTELKYSIENY
jgi:hypothetical protein